MIRLVEILSMLGAWLSHATVLEQQRPTYQNAVAPIESRVEDLLSRMTLEEKIDMIGGFDSFYIRPNERLGIPKIKMADGPLGVRNYGKATAFPATIGVAASWNKALMQAVGSAVGSEARSKGVHIILAPAVNIHRAPMCGRNFEYLGEDPFLAAQMVAAYVKGVQSQGVVATVKHFALNNQEYDRHNVSSDTDERTLQEIYLPAFKAAVQAGIGAVMTSYNLVNGIHASESRHLIQDILKGQWKFDGFVMSDWDSTYDAVRAANAGLDLEMPSGKFMNREHLVPALKEGKLKESTLDDKIRRLLRVMFRFGFFDRSQENSSLPKYSPESRSIALQAAREGIVLLKNKDNVLPLDRSKIKSILVIGPNAHPAVTGGGGSSRIEPFRAVSILDGLIAAAGNGVNVFYEHGLQSGRPDPTAVSFASKTDAALVAVGFNPSSEGEGADRPFTLPPEQVQLIGEVEKLNPRTIVVLTAGGNVSMTSWIDKIPALLHSWYPGQEGGTAVAETLFGDVNPSGKLPASFEKKWEDSAAYRSYYLQGNAKRVAYSERIFMGYRHFDKTKIEPMFPFGFGLSYTAFAYRNLRLSSDRIHPGDNLRVSFEVTNIGKRAGAEVSQLYLREVESKELRPFKELKGFAKVSLEPGETKSVDIELGEEALSYYHLKQNRWQADPGRFEVLIASSSKDVRLTKSFVLEK